MIHHITDRERQLEGDNLHLLKLLKAANEDCEQLKAQAVEHRNAAVIAITERDELKERCDEYNVAAGMYCMEAEELRRERDELQTRLSQAHIALTNQTNSAERLEADAARLEFMDKNLIHKASMRFEDDSLEKHKAWSFKEVNAWTIASAGTDLREALDAAIKNNDAQVKV
jgi:chromosome segregation ATPase